MRFSQMLRLKYLVIAIDLIAFLLGFFNQDILG
jgi:hypothetical protein